MSGTGDLLEHRTDGFDAYDTLYIGCEKFPQHVVFESGHHGKPKEMSKRQFSVKTEKNRILGRNSEKFSRFGFPL